MKKNQLMVQALTLALVVSGVGFQAALADQPATGSSQNGAIGTDSSQPGGAAASESSSYGSETSGSQNTTGMDSTQTGTDKSVTSNASAQSQAPVSGTVQSVDATQKQIQVRDDQGNSMNLNIPTTASVMNGTKKAKLSDIKTGDSVKITYGKDGKVKRVEKQSDMSSPGANSGAPTGASNTY